MAMFDRLVGNIEEGEEKIPVHPFLAFLHMRLINRVTDTQVKNMFNLTDEDMAPGGDYVVLKQTYLDVTDSTVRETYHRFVWNLFLLAEWDDADATGLRDAATFVAELNSGVTYYNTV